jgi:UPF0755 protein
LKKFKFFLPVFLLIFAYGWWRWVKGPVDSSDTTEKMFVIPAGQSTNAIASRLKQEALIKSPLVFKLLVDRKGYSGRLQAGDFRLNQAMDLEKIIDALTRGSQDYWITFPEGLRVEEYAERLAEKGGIDEQEFILAAKTYEGKLFPDTYLIPQTASAQNIVDLLTQTFAAKSPTQDQRMIIIASMIEREAKHAEDRGLVASVIYNRLEIGMALQIDATVQHILGKPGSWWPQNLTRENLQIESPYNTYKHPGLPPKPIANPSLASLQAALNPQETGYLYYLSDNNGINHYSTTLEEHNQNIELYLSP